MFTFQADGRDNFSSSFSNCHSCCSQEATAVPGEANKWRINYMLWLAGITGRGLVAPTDLSFLKLTPNPSAPIPATLPPTNIDYQAQVEANTAYSGTVSTSALSPQSSPLTFAIDPTNPPEHGVIAMNSNGTFIYIPTAGYTGIDAFAFITTDGINVPVKNVFTLGVDTLVTPNFSGTLPPGVVALSGDIQVYETPLPASPGLIYIDLKSVILRSPTLEFKLSCSPEALLGQIYRLSVGVNAMDCDGSIFRHMSTYDITITKCGF